MNLLLDSTYLFPFIGLEVRGIPRTSVLSLLSMGHTISVSEISLFELSAKGAKLVSQGELEPHKVISAIRAIHMSPSILKLPFIASNIQRTAFSLRARINDYIDCIIMSSSVQEADALVTEDALLHKVYEDSPQMFAEINPEYKVIRMSEAMREAG